MTLPVAEHPARKSLAGEVHARPPLRLGAPAQVSHLVMLSGEAAAAREHAHLARLCRQCGVEAPAEGARQFFADFGAFGLRWERHTEFSSWTVVREGPFAMPFDSAPLAAAPADWIADLPGEALVLVHVAIRAPGAPAPEGEIDALFDHAVGSLVADGAAEMWTDFRLHGEASHILIQDIALSEGQRGRVVQRLLEIETYRVLALLALPLALRYGPEVSEIDRRLSETTAELPKATTNEAQQKLLDVMLDLLARIEHIAAATNYRFGAARAYYDLVERRLGELREQRNPGLQPVGQFLRRRLTPAIRTCESLRERQETLSRRLARASALLRSRIDLRLAEQNRLVLASMNRRARLQLRLQQTVEGLSIAAITYYLVGLVGYLVDAANAAGAGLSKAVATGVAVPAAALAVWGLIHRLRRTIGRE